MNPESEGPVSSIDPEQYKVSSSRPMSPLSAFSPMSPMLEMTAISLIYMEILA